MSVWTARCEHGHLVGGQGEVPAVVRCPACKR